LFIFIVLFLYIGLNALAVINDHTNQVVLDDQFNKSSNSQGSLSVISIKDVSS
jgi:hypothetical protein